MIHSAPRVDCWIFPNINTFVTNLYKQVDVPNYFWEKGLHHNYNFHDLYEATDRALHSDRHSSKLAQSHIGAGLSHQFLWDRKLFYPLLCGICPFTRVEDLSCIKSTYPPRIRTLGSFQGDHNDSSLPGQRFPGSSLSHCTGLLCVVHQSNGTDDVPLLNVKFGKGFRFFPSLFLSISPSPCLPSPAPSPLSYISLVQGKASSTPCDIRRRSSRKQATALVSLARDPSSAEPAAETPAPANTSPAIP